MKYGLQPEHLNSIIDMLRQCTGVEGAVLFGSRARGNYRPGSDIDICLYGPSLGATDLARLAGSLEETTIPQVVDLLLFHLIKDPDLIARIEAEGIGLLDDASPKASLNEATRINSAPHASPHPA